MKPLKIQSGLFWRIMMTVCAVIMLFVLAIHQFILTPAAEHIADNELRQVTGELREDVRDFFGNAERQLRVAKEYAAGNMWLEGDAVGFTKLFSPILEHQQSLSAVIIAREDSRELILFHDDTGWRSRLSFPTRNPGTAKWLFWDMKGNLLSDQMLPSEYDCRTRPWFIGAITSGENQIFWTAPYMFYTKNHPGVTASIRFTNPEGVRHVVGFDVSLDALSTLTNSVRIGEEGYVALFDRQGRVIGLPNNAAAQSIPQRLQGIPSVADLGSKSFSAGHASWMNQGRTLDKIIRYTSGGTTWLGLVSSIRGDENNEFFIGVFVPENHFAHDQQQWLTVLGLAFILTMFLVWVLASDISRRLSKPLSQLVEQSKRIGAMDFASDGLVATEWVEINSLAQTHDHMRQMLLAATDHLEETINSRTFELQKLTRAMEQSPVTFMITDKNGTIEYVNPSFSRVTGYTAAEVLGTNPRILKSGHTPPETFAKMWAAIQSGETWRGEFVNRKKNGDLYWESVVVAPVKNTAGTITHFVGIKEDITAMKQMQQALAKQMDELKHARQAAEEATEAKSMFLANMSHEIRTPMNAIIGMAYLALRTELTAKQRDYVGKIHQAGTSLLRIINDILDFSKIEAHNLSLEQIDFQLDDVMRGVVDVTSAKAYEKGLEFLYHIPPDLPVSLVGDPLRLGQVITNLVNNALKFTSQGEVAVTVQELQRIDSKVQLQFTVRDTGIGLSQSDAAKLFQPFTQADGSTTRKYGGTGLGLSISKQLVELMEGAIWVESEQGIGTEFSFTVWLGISEAKLQRRRVVPQELNHLRVLVVDDNPAAREILVEYLRAMRFRVDQAAGGDEAIAAVRRAERDPYGVVFMDWQMPGMDGIQTAKILQADQDQQHVPAIVMVSAFDCDELRQQAENAVLAGVLIKPVSQSLLADTVVKMFAPRMVQAVRSPGTTDSDYRLAGMKVLIAEDNEINQQIAVELLESQGIRVTVANNGREAVMQAVEAQADPYDIILLDLQMPEMDGFEAARALRQAGIAAPIIALTARAMEGERNLCLAAGMNDHVAKPIDPHTLFTALANWKNSVAKGGTPGQVLPAAAESRLPLAMLGGFIPGVDIQDGLGRMGNNAQLYRRLLNQFAYEYSDAPEQLVTALHNGENEAAARLAHSIKGVAGNLGATAVQEAAAAIEAAVNDAGSMPAATAELVEELRCMLAEVIAGIGSLPPASGEEAAGTLEAEPADISAAVRQLDQLRALLVEADSEAIDFLDTAKEELQRVYKTDRLIRLEKAVNDFQFDEALVILDELAK